MPTRSVDSTQRTLGLAVLGVALTAAGLMSIEADGNVVPVLQRFDQVEQTLVAREKAAFARYEAGEIKDLDVVEREAIVPYRQVRQELLATTDVPARMRPLFTRIDELMAARLAAWNAYKTAAREQDPAQRAALFEAYKRAESETAERVAALTAELRDLKK